jgi:hypothetical protein
LRRALLAFALFAAGRREAGSALQAALIDPALALKHRSMATASGIYASQTRFASPSQASRCSGVP